MNHALPRTWSNPRLRCGRAPAGAFSVVEMLVVIVIITILLLVTIPSFNAMMYSSEESLSENLLRSATRGARDAALRSSADRDTAMVLLYEPSIQRTVLTTYVKVGTVRDVAEGGSIADPDQFTLREVFVPSRDAAPVTMPRGWMVRGFVPPNFIDQTGTADGWYTGGRYRATEGNWVFPESGFFDPSGDVSGQDRHTFMVRFEAGTGRVRSGQSDAVLLYVPSPDPLWREDVVANNLRGVVLKRSDDAESFVQRILNLGPTSGGSANLNVTQLTVLRRSLLGRQSTDMVLARPVSALAIYDETRLAAAFNTSVDRNSGSMYRPPQYMAGASAIATTRPELLAGVQQTSINRWIQGDTDLNLLVSDAEGADRPEAKIFTIDRYTGALRNAEVQP